MARTVNSEILLFFLAALLIAPAGAVVLITPAETTGPSLGVHLFTPTRDMIHSDQINDLISGPDGETILGTSFGLSVYNGSWSTRHRNLDNISAGLMDDYITALALDSDGNLWIGYSGGIQIFDGTSYRSIRDQQLLKETRIKALQRWGDDMWVATGHAGIHRVRNGTWTWYQPMTRRGPGFFEVRSMALDANNNLLFITTEVEGLWTMKIGQNDQPVFQEIAPRASTWGLLERARRDPRGGTYLFNASMIARYWPASGIVPVLDAGDLSGTGASINDIAATPDGRLLIATDNGIWIWRDGTAEAHFGTYEGLGASPVIRTIALDARNRVWYSSPGYVGFFPDPGAAAPVIPVDLVSPPVTTPIATQTLVPDTPPPPQVTAPVEMPFFDPGSALAFLNPVIDPVIKAIRAAGLVR